MEYLNMLETQILSTLQSLYDSWGWFGVAALLIFENATFIGAYVWCTLLIGAGYALGHEWTLISQYLKQYFSYLLAGGLTVIAAYVLITRRLFRFAPVRIDD